nr:unnamed protein product [Digitaria exilis]
MPCRVPGSAGEEVGCAAGPAPVPPEEGVAAAGAAGALPEEGVVAAGAAGAAGAPPEEEVAAAGAAGRQPRRLQWLQQPGPPQQQRDLLQQIQTRRRLELMLDILEKFLIRKGYCFSRFDGTTPMNARQSLVDEFNRSPSKQVFLISTRAGNLGVNLVSANRVVIFDPSWNPAQDLQAQDRSFRYGQRRHVTVFRLLGAGSLEELVYSRQIYKQQLSNIAVSGKIEKRYFEGVQDDKKIQGELFGICNLFRDLSDKLFTSEIIEMHGEHSKSSAIEATGIREIVDTDLFGSQENRKSSTATTDTDNEKLVDLGVVYAHRNEDVVNMGTNGRVKDRTDETVESSSEELQSKHEIKHTVKAKCSSLEQKIKVEQKMKVTNSYSLEQKRKEFSQIASFMGMDDLEFSKWLLAASPLQRSEALQKYKRKKKRKCNYKK